METFPAAGSTTTSGSRESILRVFNRAAFRLVLAVCFSTSGPFFVAGCGAKPVAESGQTVQGEPVRLLAKWKTAQEGGPPDRGRAQKELQQRFPDIAGWREFSHIENVIVIELKPGADPAAAADLPGRLLQTGWFHYVEPDTTVHAFPEQ